METTGRGTLTIEMDSEGHKSVVFNPVNETVWLRKCELIELFDVYRQMIDACIQAICKTNMFDMEEVCKYNCIVKAGKIEYEPYEFSLEFIIAMAFRIKSANAKILREYFIREILRPKTMFLQTSTMDIQNYEWN